MSLFSVVALGALLMATGQEKTGSGAMDKAFELRVYHTHPGRMPALEKRFKDHTIKLLEKHGMKLVGFWKPLPTPEGGDSVLVYLVEHKNRQEADKAWDNFRKDADWQKARADSEKDGPIVKKVDVQWWGATPYSSIR